MRYILGFLLITASVLVFIPLPKASAKTAIANNGIAIMELFTSQGCSSCPSADALLGKYVRQNNPRVICLSFNVDYWNRLGWKDIFSDHKYTQRQQTYASILHSDIYTPQLVVNGSSQFIGSDESSIAPAISKALAQTPAAEIQAQQSLANNILSVDYTLSGNYQGATLVAALVQSKTETKINAGENGGASLTEYNVVRNFQTVAAPASKGKIELQIPAGLSTKDCSVVLYLQQRQQSTIIAGMIIHS